VVYCVLGINLSLVNQYFRRGNRDLLEYLAGVSETGINRTLAPYGRSETRASGYLLHAAS
jgi:hypothetical protein